MTNSSPQAASAQTESTTAVGDGWDAAAPLTECLSFPFQDQGACEGEVWMRTSAGGSHFLKCDACHERTQVALDEVRNRYPDTEQAPSWFDESYAGERWNDDY